MPTRHASHDTDADLPDMAEEVSCEAPGPACPAPAVWRCSVTCPRCGRVDVDHLCVTHKAVLVRLLPRLVNACCDARPTNITWTML